MQALAPVDHRQNVSVSSIVVCLDSECDVVFWFERLGPPCYERLIPNNNPRQPLFLVLAANPSLLPR